MSKLALGTVQFGLNYGVSNISGQTNLSEATKIIKLAEEENIDLIDTAISYGDSEKTIGKIGILDFRFVSKLPSVLNIKEDLSIIVEEIIKKSLQRLGIKSLYGLLIHNSHDLLGSSGSKLIYSLNQIKARGLIEKIGVSIYSDADLIKIPLEEIDIIQLPFSIYDQRLLKNGTLKTLSNFNISIHLRSIFLQGLILNPSANWPLFINKDFRSHHERFCKYLLYENMNVLDFIFWFLSEETDVEDLVIGISSLDEFEKVLKSYKDVIIKKKFNKFKNKFKNLQWNVDNDLDPRKWNK